jgi:hypothetical protein
VYLRRRSMRVPATGTRENRSPRPREEITLADLADLRAGPGFWGGAPRSSSAGGSRRVMLSSLDAHDRKPLTPRQKPD